MRKNAALLAFVDEHREVPGCWTWPAASCARTGYGMVRWNNVTKSTHRLVYRIQTEAA